MSQVRPDCTFETTAVVGTGPATLLGALVGRKAFGAVLQTGDQVRIQIEAIDSNGNLTGDFEVSLATFDSVANTLTRNTIESSSNADGAVSFSTGVKNVYACVSSLDLTFAANPTGTIGLAVVNGSASSFMRSDASPLLSQAIVPTWTGLHTFQAQTSAKAAVFKAAATTPADIIQIQKADGTVYGKFNSKGSLSIWGQSSEFPLDVRDSSGATQLFRVNSLGDVDVVGTYSTTTGFRVTTFGAYVGVVGGQRFTFENTPLPGIVAQPVSSTSVVFSVKGTPSQSANLQEWQGLGAFANSFIAADGTLGVRSTSGNISVNALTVIDSTAQFISFTLGRDLGGNSCSLSYYAGDGSLTMIATTGSSPINYRGNTHIWQLTAAGTIAMTLTPIGQLHITPPIQTGGSPTGFLYTGALHTTLATGAEAVSINFDLSPTIQFTGGNITTQRAYLIQAPTYSFTTDSTIGTSATLAISGAPNAGAHCTIPNPYALWVQSGTTVLQGNVLMGANLSVNSNLLCTSGVVSSQFFTDVGNSVGYLATAADSTHSIVAVTRSATVVPFTIRGAAFQSTNLQEWQDSTGAIQVKIGANVGFPSGSNLGDLSLISGGSIGLNNTCFIYCKDTGGNYREALYMDAVNNLVVRNAATSGSFVCGMSNASNTTGNIIFQLAGSILGGLAPVGGMYLGASSSFGGGAGVFFIANAVTVPTSNPTAGGILFVQGGALKYRGSSGTVTTIAPA